MNFNTNQNRHLYVATSYKGSSIAKDDPAGTITLVSTGEGKDKELYLVYRGADTIEKSDRIQVKNIDYVKAVKKEKLRTPFRSVLVSLDPAVNGGNLVAGEDYILRIVLRQWIGMSDQDLYYKEAAVHATSAMAPKDFYDAMVKELNLCFSKEVGASKDENPYLSFTAQEDGILISEKQQRWTLGLEHQEPVLFEPQPTLIHFDGSDFVWGKTKNKTVTNPEQVEVGKTGYGNGHNIADLEYFSMGERGDQYRMVGWPNIIPTTYLVKPDQEYNVLEIHHAFTDDGVSSYRSDKDITIVSTEAEPINQLVKAINDKTGETFKDLTASDTKAEEGGGTSETGE